MTSKTVGEIAGEAEKVARAYVADAEAHPDWFSSIEDKPKLILARALLSALESQTVTAEEVRVAAMESALALVLKGIRSRHIKDQTLITGGKTEALSAIIAAALNRAKVG